ncbi:MAG: ComEC/Rec2 family competence protein, partial [Lachnospiraceae bacterium]|nr:ComEC/Rec2 family competence protein [Lachnospiraceae bacterium]
MKRPLVALFLSLCFGIAAAKAGTSGLLTGLIIFGAGLFLLYVAARSGLVNVSRWVCKKAYPTAVSFLLLIPVLFSAGYFRRTVYDAVTEKERAPYLSLFDSGESEVVIEGRIKRISAEDGKYEIHLKDCSVRSAYGRDFSPAGGCAVYADCDAVSEGRIPASGNTLKVYGKMRPYLNAANPGQFDAHEFHLSDREYAYISSKKLWITGENRAVFSDFVSRARNKMKDTLSMLYDREQAGILTAMLAGDRSLMEDETRALYKKAGISHILAVSGLHVSFMCMGLYNLLQRLKCGAAVSRAVAFVALVLFVIYSGAGTSAIRAGIMTTVMLLARALRRRYDMLSALAAAGIVLLLVFPHDTGNAAFVLSFSAVPGIYAANELKLKNLSGAAITLTTLPGVLFFFYETPVYGVVINIFVIPLTGCILVFGAVSALLGMIFLP